MPSAPAAATTSAQAAKARRLGVALTVFAALAFSVAGLFIRQVHADAWSIIYWRGLAAAACTVLVIGWRGGLRREFPGMGAPGLWIGVIGAAATAAYIPALKMTSIANVALISACAPFLASAGAWLWYRERPSPAVLGAAVAALIGVGVIISGSIGAPGLAGDALALVMTVLYSAIAVIYRRHAGTPAAGPAVLSSLLLFAPALWFGAPLANPGFDIALLGLFGMVFAAATVAFMEGARRLPSGEVMLIGALETPLSPLWVWLAFAERPTGLTLAGGALIFAAVLGSQGWAARRS